jgi:ABC-type Fe3+-hydroxamate transport system substrate-binding protein
VRRVTHWSLVLLLGLALSTGVGAVLLEARRTKAFTYSLEQDQRAKGVATVTDESGHALPASDYRRIISWSSVADAILLELVPTDHVVGVSRWYVESNAIARARFAGKSTISGPQELEQIVELRPDLILVSNYSGDSSPVERLRERGYRVFELGPMRGQITLVKNLRDLGKLLRQEALAERLALQFERRMKQVAAHIPAGQRKRGIYLNLYDTQLHGGTLGSSYYDVLTAAGLVDVAARGKSFDTQGEQAWPRFRVDDVLLMSPDVIVTVRGKGQTLCSLSGFETLKACHNQQGIIELEEGQLNDPGFAMLTTAEILSDRVYGKAP